MKLFVLVSLVLSLTGLARELDHNERLDRIAFGGCNLQLLPQRHWPAIAAKQPQLWIWNGDIVYADHLPIAARKQAYEMVKRDAGYRKLAETTMITGTWDDHDYGSNNTGKDYPLKKESQKLLLEFLDEPSTSPRWSREGVYGSQSFGPRGEEVQIILLDVRYFRDKPGPEADMLGEAQWRWLEGELLASAARVVILVSGTQIVPMDHNGEKWADYPQSRDRILKLIQAASVPVLIVSGDRHHAEISRLTLTDGRELYELTSSGLTHGSEEATSPNRYRIGGRYPKRNFGNIELGWAAEKLALRAQLNDITGKPVVESRFSY